MISITSINHEEALRYMAFHDDMKISEIAASYLDECEQRLLKEITPKYLYKYFPIEFHDGIPEIKGCTLKLCGNDVAEHLKGCSGVIIFCATIGINADRLIRTLQIEDMAKAVIADAFAGAAAEQVCNAAEEIIKNEFEGKYFTWRYSPGYGDFPLDIQKNLLDVLSAPKKIGLCTSKSSMLTPCKSVTAVIGVSDSPLPKKQSGCVTCNMRQTCQFRKRGTHCGF